MKEEANGVTTRAQTHSVGVANDKEAVYHL